MLRERSADWGYVTLSPVISDEEKVRALLFQMTLKLVKKRSRTENSKRPAMIEK